MKKIISHLAISAFVFTLFMGCKKEEDKGHEEYMTTNAPPPSGPPGNTMPVPPIDPPGGPPGGPPGAPTKPPGN